MVAKTLNKLSTLKLLNIRNNSITEEATDAIASIISGSSILEQLYLGDNRTFSATGKKSFVAYNPLQHLSFYILVIWE